MKNLRQIAENKYITQKLKYINSTEYANGKYKTDCIKYKKVVTNIDKEIELLEKDILQAKLLNKNKISEIKAFITGLKQCRRAYTRKPSKYTSLDTQLIFLNKPIIKQGRLRIIRVSPVVHC